MNRLLVLLLSIVSLAGCAVGGHEPANSVIAHVSDISTGPLATRPAVVDIGGKVALLYATKEGRVAFQLNDQRKLLDETARVKRGGSYFQLQAHNQALHALWWSHQDGKNIYFTSSPDSGQSFPPVSMVNDDHGVLPPFSIVNGGQGVVGVSYHDERLPNYQAYFNRSTDKGRTWATPDTRLDTPPANARSSAVFEPQTVEAGTVWVSAWTDSVPESGRTTYRILSRRSEDGGQNWAPVEVLYNSDHHISSLSVRAKDGLVVVAGDELTRGIIALTSTDQGRHWKSAGVVAGSDQVTNSGIDMTIAEGRAHLVWIRELNEVKPRIMRVSLDIASAKWLDSAQRLDVKMQDNTRSMTPSVLATKQGAIVAAWVDYRDIRPNIYIAASFDQGRTWTPPAAFLKPGEVSAGWPQLISWNDQAAIVYEVYPTEKVVDGQLFVRPLPVESKEKVLTSFTREGQVSESDRKLRLERRVKALWEARIAGDYASAYEMFDFAYKAATPKKVYVENAGVITYLSYKLEELGVTGNEAAVKMKLKYEVKPTILPTTGKPISVAPVEVDLPNTWVWVGDDWYVVYTPSFEPPQLKY